MHELSIMMEVVKQVEQVASEQDIDHVEKIVLQIGEVSGVIPDFIRECFPAATHRTGLEGTELEIETLPANGRCKQCGNVYHLTEAEGRCPSCGCEEFEFLTGREFILKEIVVWEGEDHEQDTSH